MSLNNGCQLCLKWIVLIFNLIFWLAGMGILVLAIYLRIDYAQYAHSNPYLEGYYTGIYILMAAGGIMSVIGFFGCCGAYKESPCMLGTFFTLLFVVFAIEIAAGVWAFLRKGDLDGMIDNALQYTINNYNVDPLQTEALDVIQREVRCCGIKGPRDWSDSDYGKALDIGVASKMGFYRVPKSCCSVPEDSITCQEAARSQALITSTLNNVHQEGCKRALRNYMNEFLDIIAGIGIGVAVIELLGMILSMVLCCAIRREETYKH